MMTSSNFIAKGSDGYDRYMGRWSRRLAPLFLDFAGTADHERVVDVGCGTGSLAFSIVSRCNVTAVEAIDYEAEFVEALSQQNSDKRIVARQGDACALPFQDSQFDRALSLLVLHFVSDARKAISEMRRVVKSGGVVAAAVWDNFGGMPAQRIFWDSFAAIEPLAGPRRAAATRRPMTAPGELVSAFVEAGLDSVEETMLTIRMDFESFEDYWLPLLHGQGTLAQFLADLPGSVSEEVQARVRDAYLCGGSDGPRSFASVAWAVRATVPLGTGTARS
jgi:ubiquinone/menaquinone biosynthesis C-methylase UbiE